MDVERARTSPRAREVLGHKSNGTESWVSPERMKGTAEERKDRTGTAEAYWVAEDRSVARQKREVSSTESLH